MPGRNDPCPCGSGKKYKNCHLQADEAIPHRLRVIRGGLAPSRTKANPQELSLAWEVDLVLTWLFLFRIPPFEGFYRELAPGAPCPCGQTHGYSRGGVSFPGGRTWRCGACTREWFVRAPLSALNPRSSSDGNGVAASGGSGPGTDIDTK